jgi:hypothetical protein
MQEYLLPTFFIILVLLVVLMMRAIKNKQRKVDAIRAKYYSEHHMGSNAAAVAKASVTADGFQVMQENRSGKDRRKNRDRREHFRMDDDRRQGAGRRREDKLWKKDLKT